MVNKIVFLRTVPWHTVSAHFAVIFCCLLSYIYFWSQNISPEELKSELPERQPRYAGGREVKGREDWAVGRE